MERYQGTPQGGPLSPLLAKVLLDEVDRNLERRGHRFVRYADDLMVYVRSRKAGDRVLRGLRKQFARLRLQVNEDKTAVASAFGRKFLGFAFWVAPGGVVKRAVAVKAKVTFKQRIRWLTHRTRGRGLVRVIEQLRAYLLGWKAYFHLSPACSACSAALACSSGTMSRCSAARASTKSASSPPRESCGRSCSR